MLDSLHSINEPRVAPPKPVERLSRTIRQLTVNLGLGV
jgi:hypothetical protein